MQQNKHKKVISKTVYIFEFENSENLFCCVERLSLNQKTEKIKSDLYILGKKYRMVLYADGVQKALLPSFFEFADAVLCSLNELSITKEYGKPITLGNAAEKIGSAL